MKIIVVGITVAEMIVMAIIVVGIFVSESEVADWLADYPGWTGYAGWAAGWLDGWLAGLAGLARLVAGAPSWVCWAGWVDCQRS